MIHLNRLQALQVLSLGTCDGSSFRVPLVLLPTQLVSLSLLNAQLLLPPLSAAAAPAAVCAFGCASTPNNTGVALLPAGLKVLSLKFCCWVRQQQQHAGSGSGQEEEEEGEGERGDNKDAGVFSASCSDAQQMKW